jgi:XTP/dITP diphosphohydrolase
MRILVIASGNRHKVREIRQIVPDLPVVLRCLGDFEDLPEVVEDGDTFLANARKKAVGTARETGEWALADDSGLVVPALGGDPGVRSARYAGEDADDAANRARLIREIRAADLERPAAEFRCAMVLARPDGTVLEEVEEGCTGVILDEERGTSGFGYDPLFLDEELGKTFAEIPAEEKNARSHRSRALRAMRPRLLERLSPGSP